MKFTDILYEKKDHVAYVTINRPHVLNCFRWETLDELMTAFGDASEDESIGVVVLTGAGDKAFCAGGDISVQRTLDKITGRRWAAKLLALSTLMRNMGKPIIAAVNGYCLGGGNELNLFCDLTIASDRAIFGQAGPKVGACPVWGGTQLLPRVVGDKRAREIIYLCLQYTAEQAMQMGWVNRVVPHAHLMDAVREWCEIILDRSPSSIRLAKLSINFESDLLYPSFTHAQAILGSLWGSDELSEGMQAFLEKRPANFRQFRRQPSERDLAGKEVLNL